MQNRDTIAAIATAPGSGGIAILRVSGPDALDVLRTLFRAKSDGEFTLKPRFMHYGQALDADGEAFDEVLAVYMPGPATATGEDVAEIHCHGGPGVTATLLEAAFAAGARSAGPGEFTRRAFLNGRMDLTRAEAVAELIAAPTRAGVRLAAAKLDGALAREIAAVRSELDALRVQAILSIDFPDEEAELLSHAAFRAGVEQALAAVGRLLSAFERARLWREGASCVLAGSVNAGKSSLLNALLGRERAIVSPEAGTTRDYIEEHVAIDGMTIRLTDTAGLRQGGGLVEAEGIRRSGDLASEADLALFVTDCARLLGAEADLASLEWPLPGLLPEEEDFLHQHRQRLENGSLLVVLNKADALTATAGLDVSGQEAAAKRIAAALGGAFDGPAAAPVVVPQAVLVSAKDGMGLEALVGRMASMLRSLHGSGEAASGDVAPNLRQSVLLREAQTELRLLDEALSAALPPDILCVHLDAVTHCLDSVTGSSDTEELLDRIFSTFCIGK